METRKAAEQKYKEEQKLQVQAAKQAVRNSDPIIHHTGQGAHLHSDGLTTKWVSILKKIIKPFEHQFASLGFWFFDLNRRKKRDLQRKMKKKEQGCKTTS
jgi:hypothetical protein